jgi:cytidylate kinase
VDLSHVLWIGGGQGSGRSAVAWALSRRFDLQLYVIDHRASVHEPRMPESEFRGLSMDERWVDATPQRLLDWFLTTSRHRFRLVLEDLRELAESPLVVVEGPQLLPTTVSAVLRQPDQALFLDADLDEQRERLLARGPLPGTSDGVRARANVTERDVMITQRYVREAADLRLAVLEAGRPLDELIELAVEQVRPAIERGPREADLAAVRRFENDVLATQVRLYRESLGADIPEETPLRFACECGASRCEAVVELSPAGYDALSAAGDRSPLRRPTP